MNKPELFGLFRSMQKLAETKQFEALAEVIDDVVDATADEEWKIKQEQKEKAKKG
jgi:hypothetical protein